MPRLRTGQKLKLRRGLSLKLRKAIQILALNQVELEQLIREELRENPFLEEKENISELEQIQEKVYEPDFLGSDSSESDFSLEERLSSRTSLTEYLMGQLSVMNLEGRVFQLAEAIVSNLNKQGFSNEPHQNTTEAGNFSFVDMKSAQRALQELEPTGAGAENIWQSLEWQALKKYPNDVILLDLIALLQNNYGSLESLNEEGVNELARTLQLKPDQMTKEIKRLSTLNLYPASNFEDDKVIILPDLIFIERGKNIEVQVNNKLMPEIVINEEMFTQIPEKQKSAEWVELYENAQNLAKSLDFRNNSLLKVGAAIARAQVDFFRKGPEYIVPMGLSDIAEQVELHVSTVSRIVSKKYCQTKYGVLSLKVFFPRKLKSYEGKLLGTSDLKKAITKIISEENPEFPLSDQRISIILQAEGFNIKRRTVAKYRKLLHIPSQIKRKAMQSTNSGK